MFETRSNDQRSNGGQQIDQRLIQTSEGANYTLWCDKELIECSGEMQLNKSKRAISSQTMEKSSNTDRTCSNALIKSHEMSPNQRAACEEIQTSARNRVKSTIEDSEGIHGFSARP